MMLRALGRLLANPARVVSTLSSDIPSHRKQKSMRILGTQVLMPINDSSSQLLDEFNMISVVNPQKPLSQISSPTDDVLSTNDELSYNAALTDSNRFSHGSDESFLLPEIIKATDLSDPIDLIHPRVSTDKEEQKSEPLEEEWIAKQLRHTGDVAEYVFVLRDMLQSICNSDINMADPDVFVMAEAWAQLCQRVPGLFGAFERGGADPQSKANRYLIPYGLVEELYNGLSEKYGMALRYLNRGENVFSLVALHEDDIRYLNHHIINTTAKLQSKHRVTSIQKLFDSQNILAHLRIPLKLISTKIKRGYPVAAEIALAFDFLDGDDNPFPVEYYVELFRQAALLAKVLDIPADRLTISLKDMIGKASEAVLTAIIDGVVDVQQDTGMNFKVGFHLHKPEDKSNRLLINIREYCHKKGIKPILDVGIGAKNGFHDAIYNIEDHLRQHPHDYSKEDKIFIYQQLRLLKRATQHLFSRYSATIYPEKPISIANQKAAGIPGGGIPSTLMSIKPLAEKFQLSQSETLLVVAETLKAEAPLLGHLLAVTPGYQNKLLTAIFILNRLHALGHLNEALEQRSKDKKIKLLIKQVKAITHASDAFLEQLFVGLDPNILYFIAKGTPAEPHPVISNMCRALPPLTSTPRVKPVKKEVDNLIAQGIIKAEHREHFIATGILLGSGILTAIAEHGMICWPNPEDYQDYFTFHEAVARRAAMAIDPKYQGTPKTYRAECQQFFATYGEGDRKIITEELKNKAGRTNPFYPGHSRTFFGNSMVHAAREEFQKKGTLSQFDWSGYHAKVNEAEQPSDKMKGFKQAVAEEEEAIWGLTMSM